MIMFTWSILYCPRVVLLPLMVMRCQCAIVTMDPVR